MKEMFGKKIKKMEIVENELNSNHKLTCAVQFFPPFCMKRHALTLLLCISVALKLNQPLSLTDDIKPNQRPK